MSRVSGVAEQVRVMILRGEIGIGEPIVDGAPRPNTPHRPLLEAIAAGREAEAADAARRHVLADGRG